MIDLRHGSNLDVLPTLPDASVDAIVTDPPYELGFMGKTWDATGIAYNVDLWRECLRVLKPGGHLLAFSGSRTYHRMTCAIEDAGFEVRDQIMWVYGSGFPKSLDVAKAIDKRGGNSHLIKEVGAAIKAARLSRRISASEADKIYCGGSTLWTWYEGRPAGQQMPTGETMARIAFDWPELQIYADAIAKAEREVIGQQSGTILAVAPGQDNNRSATTLDITAPATAAAQQWQGWGTALKPAHEPICVARKPLIGTVAANVLAHGTGAINVDGCRVGNTVGTWPKSRSYAPGQMQPGHSGATQSTGEAPAGRWPANLIHDGSEEVLAGFPTTTSGNLSPHHKLKASDNRSMSGANQERNPRNEFGGDTGSAARFFYCAKASKADRAAGNNHPTVKPTDLMRYLCRLVTQPGGVILDPFMGSGSTGKAAVLEGFDFIGIDMTAEYVAIADARIKHAMQAANDNQPQPDLLTGIV